jgi:periplasmic protein TonB
MNLHSRRWSDIVFENRPKDYGAYRMRTTSGKRHFWSFMLVVFIVSSAIGISILYENLSIHTLQKEEADMMLEQYQLLDAIMDEDLLPQVKQPRIPVPIDATNEFTSASKPQQTIKNELIDISNTSIDDTDPFLQELLKDEKTNPDKKDKPFDDQLYTIVDKMPSFPGGEAGLIAFFIKNLRYPYSAQQKKMQNTVLCNFIIEVDGSIKDVHLMNSSEPDLEREALRVIRAMPKWIPASKKGKAIRVKYILPVTFRLK